MHPVRADRPGGQGRDRWIRWTTTGSVLLLAAIAAVVSYRHMHTLTLAHGESRWTAALIPLSVDGMIVASSMTLLADSRLGQTGGLLPWTLLAAGSTASLAANLAVAEPTSYGRLIAAWPSFALIGAYELLMRQIRGTATTDTRPDTRHAASPAGRPRRREASLAAETRLGTGPEQLKAVASVGHGPTSRRRRRPRRPETDLLGKALRIDADHQARHGRPASAETLRIRLRIGSAPARRLKDLVRQSTTAPASTDSAATA
jgi:Protein of unknown function (DUF2637)